MKNDTLEHLSSLMDGELTQETGLFVARRMSVDAEMGNTWARYHLIRECLRRPGGQWSASGLSLDLESWQPATAPESRASARVQTWLKPVAGFAIAASVAVLAVLVVLPGKVAEDLPATASAQPFASPNLVNITPASQAASFNPSVGNQRLNSYLLRHNQVAGSVGGQGFIALVPIVTTAPVQVLDQAPEQPDDAVEAQKQGTTASTQP